MAPPPIQLFLTTIVSQPALRQRQEYILRILQVKKIPFTSYDMASDEDAKKLWKRKAPLDKQQLPGILVGGRFPGTFADFEEAVECEELDVFLRRNEDFKELDDEKPPPAVRPVGVPGAYSPSQMHPKYNLPSPAPSPLKGKGQPPKGDEGVDAGEQLSDSALQGVKVSADDLRALIEELGLGGDDASDLLKGLAGEPATSSDQKKPEKTELGADENPFDDTPKKKPEEVTKTEGST